MIGWSVKYMKLLVSTSCPGANLTGMVKSYVSGVAAIGALGGGFITGKTYGGCWSALATFALTMSGSKGKSFAFGGMAFKCVDGSLWSKRGFGLLAILKVLVSFCFPEILS